LNLFCFSFAINRIETPPWTTFFKDKKIPKDRIGGDHPLKKNLEGKKSSFFFLFEERELVQRPGQDHESVGRGSDGKVTGSWVL
jgi:hypothetical protein